MEGLGLYENPVEDSSDFGEDSDFEEDTEGDTSDGEDFAGVSSLQTLFNLAKCMIGEGMLSLAAGLGSSTSLPVGIAICICFALLMGFSFSMIGRVCDATGSKTLSGCCDRVGYPRLGIAMAASITMLTAVCCTSFCIVLGDNISHILQALGASGIWGTYEFALLAVIVVIEIPLCLIRDMSKLALTSFIGVTCELGVITFMAVRYFDGSYAPGGQYYGTLDERQLPDLNPPPRMFKLGPKTALLVCSLSTAYIAHFQAPKFYHQLRQRSMRRFNVVTAASFSLASVVFLATMSFGFLTFGRHSQGNILENYSTKDPLATVARTGMSVAVAFGFPIVFTGLRDSTLEVLGLSGARRRWFFTSTLGLLVPLVVAACFFDDLGSVNEYTGSIFGSLTSLIYPAVLCYLTLKLLGDKFDGPTAGKIVAFFLFAVGFLQLTVGTTFVSLDLAGVSL
mmetsp:Transcript_28307/g.45457  ORF Transcript_28307/g.45457 Transcript_28307/m.45457 type:complete len:452 (-) Transcript_28307:201-1556(-)